MAIVFSTFMCAVLVAHGYLSLTEYGINLSNAQLIEELLEEQESETKDGKNETDELLKHLNHINEYSIDFELTFKASNISILLTPLKSEYQEIHIPPPDFIS